MVGYIGANGAGKSTTIKMLSGILTPSSGEVLVNGVVPYKERQKNAYNIGAVFGQRTQLFWDIPVQESFQLLKHIYEIPDQAFKQRLDLFIEVLDLQPLLSTAVRQLSLGQKMRCELAAAFLHNPAVVYLDEPTIGLDVSVKSKIRNFIKEMNQQEQSTVILTTHDMQDIEEICKRIIIIDEGKILYDGDLQKIKEQFGQERVIYFELETNTSVSLPAGLEGVSLLYQDNEAGKVSIAFDQDLFTAADVISVMLQKYSIRDLTITDPRIETIVKEIYERGV
jgi:ABC-2 type transport system ATP-binding protein